MFKKIRSPQMIGVEPGEFRQRQLPRDVFGGAPRGRQVLATATPVISGPRQWGQLVPVCGLRLRNEQSNRDDESTNLRMLSLSEAVDRALRSQVDAVRDGPASRTPRRQGH
jgi:hypothetical protein